MISQSTKSEANSNEDVPVPIQHGSRNEMQILATSQTQQDLSNVKLISGAGKNKKLKAIR